MSQSIKFSRLRRRASHLARVSGGVFACALFLFPVLWMLLTSVKEQRDIFTSPPTLWFVPTLQTYVSYLAFSDVSGRMFNTVVVAIGSGLLSIFAGSMAGYALARIPLRGAAVIGTLILLSRGVPPIALAVPMFLVARRLDIADQHITLILAYCTFLIPYVMWLMRSFFLSLPRELEEAATIDGCSRFGTFFRIIVPISLPSLISTFIFSMILAWEELLFALVLTSRNAVTIPVAVASIASDSINGTNWGALCAVGTITVVPVVVFALVVQKWLVKGLTDGATKG